MWTLPELSISCNYCLFFAGALTLQKKKKDIYNEMSLLMVFS